MNWLWAHETGAVIRKELLSELRGKHGLYASLLFAIATVTAVGIAATKERPTPTLAAGMLWIALVFAAVTGLARTFLLEEEQGTGDLLRLWANPEPVFWGKTLYNWLLITLVSALIVPLYIVFVGVSVTSWGLLICALLAGGAALSSAVGMCGAIVSRASAKGALAGVISIPILLPVALIGVGALRGAFGAGGAAWPSVGGLLGMAMVFWSAGPFLFAAIWKQ